MIPILETERAVILHGDSNALPLPENSIDAVVTDPPYEISFMGKGWDGTGVAYSREFWAGILRVLKPGGHLLAFGAARTYHRIAVAIEEAGFEIRDSLHWMYGNGFPKSLDVSKAIDAAAGATRAVVGQVGAPGSQLQAMSGKPEQEGGAWTGKVLGPPVTAAAAWSGWGTALKPAHEPIILARKPLEGTVAANVTKWGTGALNIGAGRIHMSDADREAARVPNGNLLTGIVRSDRPMAGRNGTTFEPAEGGRWPANVLFDPDAAEELGAPARFFYVAKPSRRERDIGCDALPGHDCEDMTGRDPDSAGAKNPRAGAGRTVRAEGGAQHTAGVRLAKNHHPTVKPIQLMRYLCKLITPPRVHRTGCPVFHGASADCVPGTECPGGVVLDPFLGSGTTGIGALLEGFRFVGCELTPDYLPIAKARIAHALEHPEEFA